jgi:hypothetical protein
MDDHATESQPMNTNGILLGIAETDLKHSFMHIKWRHQNIHSRGYIV